MATRSAPRSLTGATVAITGAARGLGRATAEALVRRGARVAIGDLDLAQAQLTATELGPNTVALGVDVTDRDSFARFLADAEQHLGPLDVLVNNAGIMVIGPFVDETETIMRRQLDINVLGVLTGMKLALPGMLARDRGHVVNIASAAGKIGLPGETTYCASKFAVVGASEAVRAELRDTGVEVTVVMPGLANTELAAGMKAGRGIGLVEPGEVAAAIIDALERPRFEVFVPRTLGPLMRLSRVLPLKINEAMGRLFQTDEIATRYDPEARARYMQRVEGSGTQPPLPPSPLPLDR